MANYRIARLDETPGVPCPCGVARRAFQTPDNPVATLHIVDMRQPEINCLVTRIADDTIQ